MQMQNIHLSGCLFVCVILRRLHGSQQHFQRTLLAGRCNLEFVRLNQTNKNIIIWFEQQYFQRLFYFLMPFSADNIFSTGLFSTPSWNSSLGVPSTRVLCINGSLEGHSIILKVKGSQLEDILSHVSPACYHSIIPVVLKQRRRAWFSWR